MKCSEIRGYGKKEREIEPGWTSWGKATSQAGWLDLELRNVDEVVLLAMSVEVDGQFERAIAKEKKLESFEEEPFSESGARQAL